MGLYENIKKTAESKGFSINRIEKELNFARSSIAKFDTSAPNIHKIKQIADLLEVSVDELISTQKFTEDNAHLVAKIRNDEDLNKALAKYFKLPDNKKKHILELIDLLSDN